MPTPREGGHSCGMITDPTNGPKVVVAGGSFDDIYLDTVDIYSIAADFWQEGNTSHNQ